MASVGVNSGAGVAEAPLGHGVLAGGNSAVPSTQKLSWSGVARRSCGVVAAVGTGTFVGHQVGSGGGVAVRQCPSACGQRVCQAGSSSGSGDGVGVGGPPGVGVGVLVLVNGPAPPTGSMYQF